MPVFAETFLRGARERSGGLVSVVSFGFTLGPESSERQWRLV